MTMRAFKKAVLVSLATVMLLVTAIVNVQAAKIKKIGKEESEKAMTLKPVTLNVGWVETIEIAGKEARHEERIRRVRFSPFKSNKDIKIDVQSSDEYIVSVKRLSDSSYSYTAENLGTARLYITAGTKKGKGKKLKAYMDVKVIHPFKVTQTGASTFIMSFMEKNHVKKEYMLVSQEDDDPVNRIEEVKMAKDGMSAEVRMERPFTNGKKYEVHFDEDLDTFTASVGTPKAINIKTQAVFANKPTEIDYSILDEKGMDITETLDPKNKVIVEVSTDSGDYDENSKLLTLRNPGDAAKIKIIYPAQPGIKTIEETGTITCIDKSVVSAAGIDKWTISDKAILWGSDNMTNVLAQGKTSKIRIRIKKSDGTYVDNQKNRSAFTFTPIDTTTLKLNADGSVRAMKEGIEYATFIYYDGKVKYRYTLPIIVGAKAKANTLFLNKDVVIMTKDGQESFLVYLKVLDQYGDEMDVRKTSLKIKHQKGTDVAAVKKTGVNSENNIIRLEVAKKGKGGTGVYKISAAGLVTSLKVLVQLDEYILIPDVPRIDATITETTGVSTLEKLNQGVRFICFENFGDGNGEDVDRKFKGAKITVNGKEYNNGLISVDENDRLIFHPVVTPYPYSAYWKDYVVLVKAGVYEIKAIKKIGEKEIVARGFIKVINNTPEPDKSTYQIGTLSADKKSTVQGIINEVVESKLEKYQILEQSQNYAVIMHKGKKLSGRMGDIDTTVKEPFYLDTAALPSLITKEGNKIWVVKEGMNKKLTTIPKAYVEKAVTVEKAGFSIGDPAGTTGVARGRITGKNLNNFKTLLDWDYWTVYAGSDVYDLYKIEIVQLSPENTEMSVNLHIKVKEGKVVTASDNSYQCSHDDFNFAGGSLVEVSDKGADFSDRVFIGDKTVTFRQEQFIDNGSERIIGDIAGGITAENLKLEKVEILSISNIGGGTYNAADLNDMQWDIFGKDAADWRLAPGKVLNEPASGEGTINLLVKMKGLDDLSLKPNTIAPTADEEFTFVIAVTIQAGW